MVMAERRGLCRSRLPQPCLVLSVSVNFLWGSERCPAAEMGALSEGAPGFLLPIPDCFSWKGEGAGHLSPGLAEGQDQ